MKIILNKKNVDENLGNNILIHKDEIKVPRESPYRRKLYFINFKENIFNEITFKVNINNNDIIIAKTPLIMKTESI